MGAVVLLVGTAVGASVACKILLCRGASSVGARAAFPRKLCRGPSTGAVASIITDVPAWPNQTRRPINNLGICDFWCVHGWSFGSQWKTWICGYIPMG